MKTHASVQTLARLALAVAVATGCSDGRSPIAPTSASHGLAPSSAWGPGASTSVEGDPSLGPEIAAIRAATVQFHDVNAAIAAGYANPAGGVCVAEQRGGMGVHSPNMGLIADRGIDPLRPEVLLYLPKPGGGYRLIGVEYLQNIIVTDPAGSFSGVWTREEHWPPNYLESPVPELFGHPFLTASPHFPGNPWHRELHVWIWANNPTGMFEPWNPAISCN